MLDLATPSDIDPSGDSLYWEPIEREVEAWKLASRTPQFWWRDDDARRPSAPLRRLFSLSNVHQVPVTLAVIPDVDLTDLAAEVRDRPLISVSQHGCEHVNRNKSNGFSEINVHFNIAEWGPPRFRGAKPILERVARELRLRRREGRWDEPIGLITHHKNNDAESWAFLEAFFERAAGSSSGFQWRAISELMG